MFRPDESLFCLPLWSTFCAFLTLLLIGHLLPSCPLADIVQQMPDFSEAPARHFKGASLLPYNTNTL